MFSISAPTSSSLLSCCMSIVLLHPIGPLTRLLTAPEDSDLVPTETWGAAARLPAVSGHRRAFPLGVLAQTNYHSPPGKWQQALSPLELPSKPSRGHTARWGHLQDLKLCKRTGCGSRRTPLAWCSPPHPAPAMSLCSFPFRHLGIRFLFLCLRTGDH